VSGLVQVAQDDFAAGTLRGSARDVQPGVGLHKAVNVFVNDDGDLIRRGGTVALADVSAPLTWIWSGFLSGVPFEIAATADAFFTVSGAQFAAPGVPGPMVVAVFEDRIYLPTLQMLHWLGDRLTVEAWVRPAVLDPVSPLHVATIAGRLVVAAGNRIAFSSATDPGIFAATDYHGLPNGVLVMGLYALQDTLLVFTNFGLWTITNMAFDLTDVDGNVQQTLALAVPELSLLHEAGLCSYGGRVIAPCIDRVYLIDLFNPPVSISESITPLYAYFVGLGCVPGQCRVFHGTLLMPMIDSTGVIVDMLVCRLTRPVRGRSLYYPWTEFEGHARDIRAFDISLTGAAPRLLGAHIDGTITDATGIFDPTSANKLDPTGFAPVLKIETRDFPTGSGQPNHLRRIRLRYTVDDADALVQMSYCSDPQYLTWTALPTQTLLWPGDDPLGWWLPHSSRVRYVRVRFQIDEPTGSLVLHRVELQIRQATHAR
jgi:hypothetical protein